MAQVEDIIAQIRADYQKALRDQAKAQESLDKATTDVNKFRATINVLEGYASRSAKATPRDSGVAREGSKAKAIVDCAISYITEHGPTFGPVLMELAQSQNIDLGNNPKQIFASAMSRDPRVKFNRDSGWNLLSSEAASATDDLEDLIGRPSAAPRDVEGGADGTALTP